MSLMQRIHVYTTIGLICGLSAAALTRSVLPVLGVAYAVLGYLSSIKEVSTYTSKYQFFVVFLTALLTSAVMEYPFGHFPLMTAAMFFCAFGSIGRIIFFPVFTLTGYKWFEPLLLLSALATYLAANLVYDYGWAGWVFPGILILFQGILAWGVYKDMKQLGDHARGGYKVRIGTEAPDFKLPDQNGMPVSLSDFRGSRHILLIFVRGDWCPACHMMLRTYMKNNQKFQEKNVFCLAIGPDPVGVNREMVLKLGLEFKVLADDKQRTAMQYGVQLDKYDNDFADKYDEGIPLPASFLVDINGIVRYVSRPDRVGEFLDPGKIFPILEKLN
ncbi:MAG: redoxin domain-containing protein [Bacteroidota bacterium]